MSPGRGAWQWPGLAVIGLAQHALDHAHGGDEAVLVCRRELAEHGGDVVL
jgi:hypothetical protein